MARGCWCCALVVFGLSYSAMGENTRDADVLIDQVLSERGKVLSAHARWTRNNDWITYSNGGEPVHKLSASTYEGWVDKTNIRLDTLNAVDPNGYGITERTRGNVYVFARSTWMSFNWRPSSEAAGPRQGSYIQLSDSRIGLIHDGIDINPANAGFEYLLKGQVEPDFAKLLRPDHAEVRIVSDEAANSKGQVVLEINYQDHFRVARFFMSSKDYSIARYEGYGGADKAKEPTWRSQMEFTYKEYKDGVLFPAEVHYKNWDSGLLTHTCDYKVASAEINQPVDPVLFTIVGLNLDDNVQVLDARLGTAGYLGRIGDFRKENLLSDDAIQVLLSKRGSKEAAATQPSGGKAERNKKAGSSCSPLVYVAPKAKTKWDAPRIGVLLGGLLLVVGGIHAFLKRKPKAEDSGK